MSGEAKRPKPTRGWLYVDRIRTGPDSYADLWRSGTLIALSGYEMSEKKLPSGLELLLPHYHVSVSDNGRRASDDAVRSVLADFDMEGADEDNHLSGIARNFWMVADGRKREPPCECKATEETIVEPDGYQWQKERPRVS